MAELAPWYIRLPISVCLLIGGFLLLGYLPGDWHYLGWLPVGSGAIMFFKLLVPVKDRGAEQ